MHIIKKSRIKSLVYKTLLPTDSLNAILESAICPPNTFELSFDDFIKARIKLLVAYANKLIE